MFSNLRGAARGARVSWHATGGRTPTLSVYGSRPGLPGWPRVFVYGDQLRIRSQTLFDAEVGSDKSHYVRSRLATARLAVEASYRHSMTPQSLRDRGVQAGVKLWRNLGVAGGFFLVDQDTGRTRSGTLAVRLPISRFLDLTVERAMARTPKGVTTSTAAMASLTAGQVHLFHRYQQGQTTFTDDGITFAAEREQLQSMASYAPGPRLNVTLQLATAWRDSGPAQQWEEVQTSLKLTRGTTLQIVTAVPDVSDDSRLRARLTQQLGGHYALQLEYGRLATFQDMAFASDRPRFKVMLRKSLNVPTPIGGSDVRGRVLDQNGRPVAGARVTLGAYTAESAPNGIYAFAHVPNGDYDLALEEAGLPADYAWDGRRLRLAVRSSGHVTEDLLVAPLNAVHGRVYVDRNGNGRFDANEGVGGAVVRLEDRVTATDRDGSYDFYNLWPGPHVVALDRAHLPPDLDATDRDHPAQRRPTCDRHRFPGRRENKADHLAGNQMSRSPLSRGAPIAAAVWLLAIVYWLSHSAPVAAVLDSVKVTLPMSVSFAVPNVSASTTGSPSPTTASFSNAVLILTTKVRLSVKADSNFVPPSGPAIPAALVSWTTSSPVQGVGSNGTLSTTAYGQLFESTPNKTSGSVNVTWTLAAPGTPLRRASTV
jgi:Carboxypeptidase regulatory-like domain